MSHYDVAIIGGGLIGCASAYYLSKSGAKVVLLERDQLNQGASGRNAGSLHFQLEHRLIVDLDTHRRELEFYVGLAKLAIEHCRGLSEELDCDLQVAMHGGLMVAQTREQCELLERKASVEQSQGLDVELLSGEAARRLAPYLDDSIQAALHCPHEGHSNPRLLTLAFARKAEYLGTEILTGHEVTALARDGRAWKISTCPQGGRAGARQVRSHVVLNAAGAWASQVAALANLHLPLFPVALTMNVTEKAPAQVTHLIQHVGRKLSLKQTEDGNLLIGGGWSARLRQSGGQWNSSRSPKLRFDSVLGNLRTAAEVVPMVRNLRLLRSWTGATAITADQLPVLGEVAQAPGFFVAAGGSGYTYGPTYAQLLSAQILTGASPFPLEPFSPTRFGGLNAFMA